LSFDTNDYIYCKVLEKGTGTVRPVYTDSVSTHYRGQLIPLYNGSTVVFDQSYKGELNTDFAQPVTFSVQGVIEGWTTALQHMVEGDRWEVYIPSRLGYGQAAMDAIPTNSTLIFDMQLVKVITSR
jgi:FKBP-type peptidyl-prolyl cis-trans isomerase FklB